MLTASCHCGAVRLQVPRRPRTLTSCNCSICRRYGTLWAYYKMKDVRVLGARTRSDEYSWGDRSLKFLRCGVCGCVTHWSPVSRGPGAQMGVNARNFEPAVLAGVRVRRLDGAHTWKYLD
jgi:hypothetical protein